MKTRNFALCALGLAAAFSLGGSVTASAQRATSPTRIPVRKDTKKDTAVTVVKTDTVRVVRVDTVMSPPRVETRTVTVHDTVTKIQMEMLPEQKLPGVYFGLGAGIASPFQSWRGSTKDGPVIQGQLGWFPKNGALGLRVDGDYAFLAHRATDCPNCPDPKLLSGSADLVLRLPLDRKSPLNPVIYFLGGGGLDKFSDFLPYRNSDNAIVTAGSDTYLQYPGNVLTATTAGDKSLFYHYDAGFGLDFNAGPAHMYLESKYVSISTTNGNSHYFPIVAGFKFY
ncbi:MAG: hypothetical protein ABJE47_03525 [bacterium]